MSSTIRGFPRRVVFDWSPEAGEHEAWLAELYAAGWEPDVGAAPEGSTVRVGGRQIVRHALRESAAAQAAREMNEQARRQAASRTARPSGRGGGLPSGEDWAWFEPPER